MGGTRVDSLFHHFLLLIVVKLLRAISLDSTSATLESRVGQALQRDDPHRLEDCICELRQSLEFFVVCLKVVEAQLHLIKGHIFDPLGGRLCQR